MASRKTKIKKIIAKKLPKFELDVYSNIALSDLVVFALSYLEEREIIATPEEMVSICFRLFPHGFGLKSYPRWPDSALVIRRLNDAREKKNIKGNTIDGFALTYKGKLIAKRVAKALGIARQTAKPKSSTRALAKKLLKKRATAPIRKTAITKEPVQSQAIVKKKAQTQKSQPKQVKVTLPTFGRVQKKVIAPSKQVNVKSEAKAPIAKPVKPSVTNTKPVITPISVSAEEKAKAGKVIKLVERSDAYHQYKKNGKQARISEFDFRNMLVATMESSSDTLTRNVEMFKRYASIHNRNDLITFLNFCEDSFASLLKKKVKA